MALFTHLGLMILVLSLQSLVNAFPHIHNLTSQEERRPICTTIPAWVGRAYDPNDCIDALQKLENSDFKIYRSLELEFLALGATPKTELDKIRLPRKYISKTCTLTIAMLVNFGDFTIPGQVRDRGDYATTDVSKFSYLLSVASWVDGTCVAAKSSKMGWCSTGDEFSIGVFFAATGSVFDKETRRVLGGGNSSLYHGGGSTLTGLMSGKTGELDEKSDA